MINTWRETPVRPGIILPERLEKKTKQYWTSEMVDLEVEGGSKEGGAGEMPSNIW